MQPISDTLTVISTVEANRNIYGTVFIANTSEDQSEFVRLALRPSGSISVGDEQYLLYDTEIPAKYMMQLANIGLNGNDSLVGYSANGFAVFNLTGDEIRNYT